MEQNKRPNKLIHEKSPYLLQHAYNPVDWYSWGDEAFARARTEHKPIFLSVGYSTCHWCHVMEHESFEDDSIAALMNTYFVCIKVDREERPDIDKVYMTALQGMGQHGGWPMSMFLTPELHPFYGGTYFPPQSRYGRIGFPDLLTRIHQVWETDSDKVLQSATGIVKALQEIPTSMPASSLDSALLDTCYDQFDRTYDQEFGGFGKGGPKFPRPSVFNFLLRYYARTGNARALEMTTRTLQKMSAGGIYDHIGGGFHRYSVDAEWRIPHFEKMLYDQAQLVNSYIDVFQITKDPLFVAIIREVLDYVMRDMTHPEGGFYSAEDADSRKPDTPEEKGEGAFYLWTKKELLSLLGKDDGELFCLYYGVEEAGNAPFDPQHEFTGKNILYISHFLKQVAISFSTTPEDAAEILTRCKAKLFDVRSNRPRPHLDDKVLTSWNGLMISAFARAYQVFQEPKYLSAARRSAEFVLKNMRSNGYLVRRFRDGEARHDAHLDDYAFFVQGLLDLYEACFEVTWLTHALEITQTQLDMFWDANTGGFFDTSGKDSSILVRMKEQYDGAEPTGSSIGAMNLLRLAQITNKSELREKGERTLLAFGEVLRKQPVVMPQMVAAYDFFADHPQQIVVAGGRHVPATRAIINEIYTRFLPNKVVILLDGGNEQDELFDLNSFYASLAPLGDKPTAYVCQDSVCQLPTTDIEELRRLMDNKN